MKISHLEVNNFKSFKHLNISLSNLNIIIGANASGKSNFLQIFKFLRDVEVNGIDDALSLHGGAEYILNSKIGITKPLFFKIESTDFSTRESFIAISGLHTNIQKIVYEFAIKFENNEKNYNLIADKVSIQFQLSKEINNKKKISEGILTIENNKEKFDRKIQYTKDQLKFKDEEISPFLHFPKNFRIGRMLLGTPFYNPLTLAVGGDNFKNITVYDFDPKTVKLATTFTGKSELSEDGKNLAIVLKDILKNEDAKKRLHNLIHDVLPFVNELNVEKFADKFLFLSLKEKYSKRFNLPASLLSDGTINVAALIIGLYFQMCSILIIEEPEKNIHPQLIMKIMNMIKEVSKKKQIIITTHNPELLKHIENIDNIFFLKRDSEGYSEIIKPAESKDVQVFIKNQIGIEDLFIKNLL